MTLRDLVKKFFEGRAPGLWSESDKDINGMRAVVQALAPDDDEVAAYTRLTLRVRKEMPCECEYLPEDRCISCEVADALTCLEKRYHEILGDAGAEKVAGGPSSNEDTVTAQRRAALATDRIPDPAPAVCVWTPLAFCWQTSCGRHPHNTPPAGYPNCACGKPITFTEAKA